MLGQKNSSDGKLYDAEVFITVKEPYLFLSDESRCLRIFRGPEGSRDLDASISALVRLTSGQHVSASVVASSIQLLEAGVKQRLVDARKVCDALLSPAHMKHDNKAFWIQGFKVR